MLSARVPRELAGVTLVELVAFLVVISIGAVALLGSYRNILPRAPTPAQITQAALLAQERMELIAGNRGVLGSSISAAFATTALDPCPSANAFCPLSSPGFGMQVLGGGTTAVAWLANPTTTHRQVTVTVSSASGTQLAQLITVFTNY